MSLLALLLAVTSPALIPLPASASSADDGKAPDSTPYSLDEILAAIRSVETGGEKHFGRHATGDDGRAIGPYQIHWEHWLDTRLPGQYEDCRDPLYARYEVITYWRRWCPTALAGRDAQTLARVHNGGPAGSCKAATLPYWEKTKARLEEARAPGHGGLPPSTTHSSPPRSMTVPMPAATHGPYPAPLTLSTRKNRRNSVQ